MLNPEQSGVFSRRTIKHRGPMLLIFEKDQASLPEEDQRPHVIVELDGEASQCSWVSREPVEGAKATVLRIIGRKRELITLDPNKLGFRVAVDNVFVGYEGDYGQGWSPRFWCNAEEGTLPVKPLSQLIASTVMGRGFPQRVVEGLITDFMRTPYLPAA